MKAPVLLVAAIFIIVMVSLALAFPFYTGFSGAPGSNGACAAKCHGSPGGTIEVSGFPSEYEPNQIYELSVYHVGGSQISQFNGSCRVGEGSDNAGIISAGFNTSLYSVPPETNGVRFAASDQDSGTFFWTAPEAGTGPVRLYVAGLQGGFADENSTLVYLSDEMPPDFTCGDADGDEVVNILDITFLINYLYKGGPAPDPLQSTDVNSDGAVNILDVTYLINYLYREGPDPNCPPG